MESPQSPYAPSGTDLLKYSFQAPPEKGNELLGKVSHWYNPAVISRQLNFLLFIVFFLAACTPQPEQVEAPTATLASIDAYSTVTSTIEPTQVVLETTPIPQPSPTPFLYQVLSGDTMIGIANRFGITLQTLQAANPGVDPQFLSVGVELMIPFEEGEGSISTLPSLEPVSLEIREANCYFTASGEIWCFGLVYNPLENPVENVSAEILLFSAQGELVASQVGLLPLNILNSGAEMPIVARFPAPGPTWDFIQVNLLTAITVDAEDTRYIEAEVLDFSQTISTNGLSAAVNGNIVFSESEISATTVWLAIIAYDHAGRVVGLRRWEQNLTGEEGLIIEFEVLVYSLGPAIDSLNLQVEVRP